MIFFEILLLEFLLFIVDVLKFNNSLVDIVQFLF